MTNKEILTEEDLRNYEKLTKKVSAMRKEFEKLRDEQLERTKEYMRLILSADTELSARQIAEKMNNATTSQQIANIARTSVFYRGRRKRITSYCIACDENGNVSPNAKVESKTETMLVYSKRYK